MTAIGAASSGAKVTILEQKEKIGKKILSTGNGRCNMTNEYMESICFRCDQEGFPMKVIERFNVKETLELFEEIGIFPKSKNGYIYPNSEQAVAVVDRLAQKLRKLKVTVITDCKVLEVQKHDIFHIVTSKGNHKGDRVILAAGSKAASKTGSDGSGYEIAKKLGHGVIQPLPALVQLRCKEKHYKTLAGIRCEASVEVIVANKALHKDKGEVQLTDYGISGIPVFQISRFASVGLNQGKKVEVFLDFLPNVEIKSLEEILKKRMERSIDELCEEFLVGLFHRKLGHVLLQLAGISITEKVKSLNEKKLLQLAWQIKNYKTQVIATNSFEQAQICCGGVDTKEIDTKTMESKKIKGLYIVGELLDVDGICGGYNLQWAWSSGMLAGRSIQENSNDKN